MSDDENLDEESGNESPNIRQLREKAKRADQAEQAAQDAQAQLDAMRREVEFRKAGIDPDDPKAKYFAKAYDGDLTAEAIKAEAETAGILQPANTATAEEIAAHQRVATAAEGASADAPQTDVLAQLRAAGSPEEVSAIMERHGYPVEYSDVDPVLLGRPPI